DQLRGSPPSTTDAELVDDDAIPFRCSGPKVFQEPTPLADEHQEPAARMGVFDMLLEMIGQAVNALGQERDLHLRRTRIALVGAELLDQTLLAIDGKRHRLTLQSPTPREPGV